MSNQNVIKSKQGEEFRAKLIGFRSATRHNKYIPRGTIGKVVVTEVSIQSEIMTANFYPDGSTGFGEVIWPILEKINE